MRLTKSLKDTIVTNWYIKNRKTKSDKIDKAFKKDLLNLLKIKYKDKFSIAVRYPKLLKSGYLAHRQSMSVNLGRIIPQYQNDSFSDITIDTPTYCNKIHEWFHCEVDDKDKKIISLIDTYERHYCEIGTDIKSIRDILWSVTTVKKLLDIVPNFDKYLPKSDQPSTGLISITLVNDVKALL